MADPIPLFKVFMAPDAAQRVAATLQSGMIAQGPRVDELESQLCGMLGVPVLTTSSGTAALDLALHCCEVGPGDFVLTTAMTCTATNGVIVRRGATPVWCDVHPDTGLIDVDSVRRALAQVHDIFRGRNVRAIMAVDWAGRACDYEALKSLGLPVIEDAAHAWLARTPSVIYGHGVPVATHGGDYVCWSSQAIKHFTTGDGGALKTPDVATRDRARLLRWFGLDRLGKADFRAAQNIQEIGYKYHMNDVAASIGLANLPHLPEIVHQHRANAAFYHKALVGSPGVRLPPPDPDSSWWLYTLLVDDRPSFMKWMAEQRIQVSEVHARNDRHDAFRRAGFAPLPMPGLDEFAAQQVSIPVGWWLSPRDTEWVADAVVQWAKLVRGSTCT
jgi:dTDP-4-amino-4,6-dideoxygalactose transaminase